jgi:hypothetical protein
VLLRPPANPAASNAFKASSVVIVSGFFASSRKGIFGAGRFAAFALAFARAFNFCLLMGGILRKREKKMVSSLTRS